MATFSSRLALGVAFAAVVCSSDAAQSPPGPTDWPSSNFTESANRYSPLDQITAANVASLQPAWRFHLKPAGYPGSLKLQEAIPVVIGNTMYIASPYGAIHALDATTGVEKWKYQLPNSDVPSKRGLAYWRGGNGAPASSTAISTTDGYWASCSAPSSVLPSSPVFAAAGSAPVTTSVGSTSISRRM